jgi:hypothetical protein
VNSSEGDDARDGTVAGDDADFYFEESERRWSWPSDLRVKGFA